jgi:hypothetical protein
VRAGWRRAGLATVLAAAAFLAGWGLDWGLPAEYGWAPDEVLPRDVAEAAAQRFSGGWHSKYPPFHFALLALVTAPARLAGGNHAAMAASRLLSLAMGLATLASLFALTRRLAGDRAAVLGAAVFATSVPFVYYAKTANLDVPYVFWSSLALLAFVRFGETHRPADAAGFAVAAAAAAATKDQAFALFVLPAFVMVAEIRRARLLAGAAGGVAATLHDRRFLALAGSGLLAYLLLANVLGNPAGFAAHVRLITGPASRDFRMFPAGPAGELRLAYETLRHLAFAMGWPALVAAVAGIAMAARPPRDRRLLSTLSFPVSYALFFLAVVLYVYDRFLLPVILVLAPFAGVALDRAWRARRAGGALGAACVLGFSLVRAVSVDVLLAGDGRYEAEAWLRREAAPPLRVAAVGPLGYLPRLEGLEWRRLGPAAARIQAVRPDVVVVNADYAARADPGSGERAFYDGLEDGSLGYTLAYRHRARPLTPLLDVDRLRTEGPGRIWSNLDKADPEIRIYRRVP